MSTNISQFSELIKNPIREDGIWLWATDLCAQDACALVSLVERLGGVCFSYRQSLWSTDGYGVRFSIDIDTDAAICSALTEVTA